MYDDISSLYDALTTDMDPHEWAEYFIGILTENGIKAKSDIVEAGCGTGKITAELLRYGYSVTGIDISEQMLRSAQEKLRKMRLSCPLIHGDMRHISVHKPVSAVLAPCDCVNYLLEEKDLTEFLSSACNSLKDGGIIMFDISSVYKLSEMDEQLFFEDLDDVTYFWENSVIGNKITMDLTFFIKENNGSYRRFDEEHIQRLWEENEITDAMRSAGFDDIMVYAFGGRNIPEATSKRLQFVGVKKNG